MNLRTALVPLCFLAFCACSARQPDSATPPRDTHERLNATLWIQTSAEYQALVATTYRAALEKIRALSRQASAGKPLSSAALEQSGVNGRRLPLAVIMDIDETVLDNSPLSSEMIEKRVGWDADLWTEWVGLHEAATIRGAADFIRGVRAAGVKVYFITNRKQSEERCTVENLKALDVRADEILSVGETDPETGKAWDNEKSARRLAVARRYWIAGMVGDDLADFVPDVRGNTTPAQRVAVMQRNLDRFGERWFLLPNPIYGSWEAAIADPSQPDTEQLAKKHRKLKRFDRAHRSPCTIATPTGGAASKPAP